MIDIIKLRVVEEEIKQNFPIPTMYSNILGFFGDLLDGSVCCPFHEERTPSFSYSKRLDIWTCFGECNKHGDSVELYRFYVEKHKGLKVSRQVAVEMLMKIPEINGKLSIKDITTELSTDFSSYLQVITKGRQEAKLKDNQKVVLSALSKVKTSKTDEEFKNRMNTLLYSKIGEI